MLNVTGMLFWCKNVPASPRRAASGAGTLQLAETIAAPSPPAGADPGQKCMEEFDSDQLERLMMTAFELPWSAGGPSSRTHKSHSESRREASTRARTSRSRPK
jgi:hypothetical protein